MALAPGDKLGPYEIVTLIGAGGMGEVYRAHDSRLRRDVAIKVSKEQFTERFEREARAVAALNHSNIAHLYDIGPNYLVMKYVEGESPAGPLPLAEAVRIAGQIAEALEAAHEKNIIHRDLKPANIKITPEGVVKVLDFGLAKTFDEPASGSSAPGYSGIRVEAGSGLEGPARTDAGAHPKAPASMPRERSQAAHSRHRRRAAGFRGTLR
jgi:serine/threonine-protein kinase